MFKGSDRWVCWPIGDKFRTVDQSDSRCLNVCQWRKPYWHDFHRLSQQTKMVRTLNAVSQLRYSTLAFLNGYYERILQTYIREFKSNNSVALVQSGPFLPVVVCFPTPYECRGRLWSRVGILISYNQSLAPDYPCYWWEWSGLGSCTQTWAT